AVKPHALPARKPLVEPPQNGIRRSVVKAPAELPYLAMAWRAPVLRDPRKDDEVYALSVLAGVLGGYDGARLKARLVRELQVAQELDVSYDDTNRGEALFAIDGTPAPGKSMADLEAAIRSELQRLKAEGVSEDELRRVKVQIVAAQVYKRDSLMGQAMELGMDDNVGLSWKDDDYMLERLRQVTPAQVQAVAAKFLQDDSLSVVQLDPQPLDPKAQARPAQPHRH
ncbi:MAG: insulinase family protein, partial [Rhodocyclales bacterium]|nr:insulinase family protein [Rhodocyclales bacterium]